MAVKDFAKPSLWPECRCSRIVFVDGYYDSSLSDLSQLPISCTLHQQDETLVLYIPPETAIDAPVQIASWVKRPALSYARLQILLGRNARLDLVQTVAGEGMATDSIDVMLDEGAHLRMAEEVQGTDDSKRLRLLRAFLQKDARLSSFSYSKGRVMLQRDWQVVLSGEGAEVELKGLDDLKEDSEVDTHLCVHHCAPRCRSRQHFKKVLQDKSRTTCEGRVCIESIAHGSDAHQLCQNLLLSNRATAVVRPFLNILVDDVSVKHGATFSQIDDEELFYCRSRGIDEREAKEIWRQSFCRELLDAIEIPLMRDKVS